MSSSALGKSLVLAVLACALLPIACGDTDENPNGSGGTASGGTSTGGATAGSRAGSDSAAGDGVGMGGTNGAGGAGLPDGISETPSTITCGAATCESVTVNLVNVFVDPCCPEGMPNTCGIRTGFLTAAGSGFEEECQPLDQPGEADDNCPASMPIEVPFEGATVPVGSLAGCCREETGTCGFVVDALGSGPFVIAAVGLGCVADTPFAMGAEPQACGDGAGGSPGAAGAGSGSGGAPAAGGGP